MDTNLKNKELIYYGASCLVVLSCNEDLRASLSEGDGISLIVDALHCHKKDDPTAVVLQALLVNLLHRNSAAKKAGVASNCVPIALSILTGAHNRDKVLMSSLHLLRHLSTERDVRLAESKNRSQIFKEVIAAIVDNTQNEPIVAHGLWIFLNLMNGSHDNKSRFLGENGVALLETIAQDQQRNDSIMYLVSATYHQLLKVQRIRTELFAKHTLAHLKRNLETFSEPKPLIATYRALYAFAFHSTARNSIGLETAPFIIQHLQLPHIAVGLAAILGKLVLKLCLDPTVKERLVELKGIDAVRAAIGHSQDQLGALRFLVAAEEFLNSPTDAEMPPRPDVADLLLMHHVHSEENRRDSMDSPRSESSSSSVSSESDDEISAELKNETSPRSGDETMHVTPIPTTASKDDNKSPRKSPRADTPVPIDDEMAALLEDIEISTSPMASPQPSPVKSKAHHMKVTVTPKVVLDLDDSFSDLDAELEKLKEDDFGGIRALDRFDDLASGGGDNTGSSIASEDATDGSSPDGASPDDILARIEAIEKMTEELDSMASSNTSASDAVGAPSYAEVAALPAKDVPQTLDELDDAVKALEMAQTAPSPEPTETTAPIDSVSPRSDDSEETSKVDNSVHSDSEETSSKTDSDETTASTDSSPIEPIAADLDLIAPVDEKEPEATPTVVEAEPIPSTVESEPVSPTVKEDSTPEAPVTPESSVDSTPHVEEAYEPPTTIVPEEPKAATPIVDEEPSQQEPEVEATPVSTPPTTQEPETKAEPPKSPQNDAPTVQAAETQPEPVKPATVEQNGTASEHSTAPSTSSKSKPPPKKSRVKGDKTTATSQVGITKQTRAQPVAVYATVGVLLAVIAAAAVSYML